MSCISNNFSSFFLNSLNDSSEFAKYLSNGELKFSTFEEFQMFGAGGGVPPTAGSIALSNVTATTALQQQQQQQQLSNNSHLHNSANSHSSNMAHVNGSAVSGSGFSTNSNSTSSNSSSNSNSMCAANNSELQYNGTVTAMATEATNCGAYMQPTAAAGMSQRASMLQQQSQNQLPYGQQQLGAGAGSGVLLSSNYLHNNHPLMPPQHHHQQHHHHQQQQHHNHHHAQPHHPQHPHPHPHHAASASAPTAPPPPLPHGYALPQQRWPTAIAPGGMHHGAHHFDGSFEFLKYLRHSNDYGDVGNESSLPPTANAPTIISNNQHLHTQQQQQQQHESATPSQVQQFAALQQQQQHSHHHHPHHHQQHQQSTQQHHHHHHTPSSSSSSLFDLDSSTPQKQKSSRSSRKVAAMLSTASRHHHHHHNAAAAATTTNTSTATPSTAHTHAHSHAQQHIGHVVCDETADVYDHDAKLPTATTTTTSTATLYDMQQHVVGHHNHDNNSNSNESNMDLMSASTGLAYASSHLNASNSNTSAESAAAGNGDLLMLNSSSSSTSSTANGSSSNGGIGGTGGGGGAPKPLATFAIVENFETHAAHKVEEGIFQHMNKLPPKKKENLKQLGVRFTGQMTLADKSIVVENFIKFCQEYDVQDHRPFLSLNQSGLNKPDQIKFARYLGQGLPTFTLFCIYSNFKNLFCTKRTEIYTKDGYNLPYILDKTKRFLANTTADLKNMTLQQAADDMELFPDTTTTTTNPATTTSIEMPNSGDGGAGIYPNTNSTQCAMSGTTTMATSTATATPAAIPAMNTKCAPPLIMPKVLENLVIYENFDVHETHRIEDGVCTHITRLPPKKQELLKQFGIQNNQSVTYYDKYAIVENFIKFCNDYKISDHRPFLDFHESALPKCEQLKFVRYLGQGVPNLTLNKIYLAFKDILGLNRIEKMTLDGYNLDMILKKKRKNLFNRMHATGILLK